MEDPIENSLTEVAMQVISRGRQASIASWSQQQVDTAKRHRLAKESCNVRMHNDFSGLKRQVKKAGRPPVSI